MVCTYLYMVVVVHRRILTYSHSTYIGSDVVARMEPNATTYDSTQNYVVHEIETALSTARRLGSNGICVECVRSKCFPNFAAAAFIIILSIDHNNINSNKK